MSTYLIIGVNRGLGLEFVKQIGSDPKNTIIGTVRKEANVDKLKALNYSNIKIINIDMSEDLEAFRKAFSDLETLTPNGIDVIIHNAGVGGGGQIFEPLYSQPASVFTETYDINTVGALKTYQAIYPRLETNGKPVKYVFISSMVASIGDMKVQFGGYGASKAGLNFFVKLLSRERAEKGDIVVPVHPGLVDTDMIAGADHLVAISIKPQESVSGLLKVIGGLKKEDNGRFLNYDGEELVF